MEGLRAARPLWAGILCLGLAAILLMPLQVAGADNPSKFPDPDLAPPAHQVEAARSSAGTQPPAASQARRADFGREQRSRNAQHVLDWVVDSGDSRGMPFAIVDKVDAKVFVFDEDGRLRGAAPVLLGLARGDHAVPGIGDRKLSEIRPEERTTPAGRFVAALGFNFSGKDVLWVDYDGAVSLHRVVTNNPKERRLERLASPTPLDNRISFGCINVPANFFNDVVKPVFTGKYCVVYVLPDTRPIGEVFNSYYDVKLRQGAAEDPGQETGQGVRQQGLRAGRQKARP